MRIQNFLRSCSGRLAHPRLFTAVLLGAVALATANATTYYVATTGSDSNAGTSTAPFRTIQKAMDRAVAGDTILVRSGSYVYTGAASCFESGCSSYYAGVTIAKAGTPSAYITLKSETKWGAIIDCNNACDAGIVLTSSAAYVTIDGFVITRAVWDGIHANSSAHDIAIHRNRIEYIGNRSTTSQYGINGLFTGSAIRNFVIDCNYFTEIGRIGGTNHDHALYLHGSGFTITNNIFYNITHGWALQAADGLSNVLLAHNTFAFPNPNRDGQIVLWDTQNSITIRNNIFYNPRTTAITRWTSTVNGCTIDNNIVYGAGSVIDNSTGCTVSSNRIGVNPLLENASTAPYDFHIKAGSPAIDTAAPVASVTHDADEVARPQGAGYDVGAYEKSGTTVAPLTITNLGASGITTGSATITWTTNNTADSQVEYGVGSFTNATPVDPTPVTSHQVTLTGLSLSTRYLYHADSRDALGHTAVSSDLSFTTPAAGPFDFSLTASPAAITAGPGQPVSSALTAALSSGTAQTVSFTLSGVPAGVSASLTPTSCPLSCSTQLALTPSATAAAGVYNIGVTASGGGVSRSATVGLTIPSVTLGSGLLAYWKMDEATGTVALDATGNNNTAAFQGSPAWIDYGAGTAISLDGSSYLSANSTTNLELTNEVTVAAWVRIIDVPNVDERIIAKSYSWDVKLNGAARRPQLSSGGKYAVLNYTLPTGIWKMVVFTFRSGAVTGYIDGVKIAAAEQTFVSGDTLPLVNAGLRIGTDTSGSATMQGTIDDARIYNRALSDAEVSALFTETQPGRDTVNVTEPVPPKNPRRGKTKNTAMLGL